MPCIRQYDNNEEEASKNATFSNYHHRQQFKVNPFNSADSEHVNYRISYKLSLLSWKALHTAEPSYLSELISHYAPTRTLRSANTGLLALPTGVTSHFSSRSFSVSSPSVWNSLPAHVRSIDNLCTFKRHLKSHLFQSTFTA